jgi:Transposase DDE domain.
MYGRRSSSGRDRIDQIIKVTDMVLEGLGIPKHSSEFSNRLYDDRLKIELLIVRQYLDISFRELCTILPSLRVWNGRCPDHSTLVKFSAKVGTMVLDRVLRSIAMMLCRTDMTVAVDSTGFSCSNASRHFVKRLKEMNKDKKITYAGSSVKGFSKTSLAVDTSSKMILACDCVDSDHADVKRMSYIVDDLVDGGFKIKYIVADKGYDAEYVHADIRERLNAKAFIPIRKWEQARIETSKVRTTGFNRGMMKFFFDKDVYDQRCQVETVNSMIKRKMGDTVYGKTELSRHKEILLRCIAHNIRRFMDAGILF